MKPLSLAEVKGLVNNLEEKKNLESYLKKFGKLDVKNSGALGERIRGLDNLKIKKEHIAKLVDFLPKNSEEVNKIFNDVPLTEEEINAILEIVKEY